MAACDRPWLDSSRKCAIACLPRCSTLPTLWPMGVDSGGVQPERVVVARVSNAITADDVRLIRRLLVDDLRRNSPMYGWRCLPSAIALAVRDLTCAEVRTGLVLLAIRCKATGALSVADTRLWIDSAGLRGVRVGVRTLAEQLRLSVVRAVFGELARDISAPALIDRLGGEVAADQVRCRNRGVARDRGAFPRLGVSTSQTGVAHEPPDPLRGHGVPERDTPSSRHMNSTGKPSESAQSAIAANFTACLIRTRSLLFANSTCIFSSAFSARNRSSSARSESSNGLPAESSDFLTFFTQMILTSGTYRIQRPPASRNCCSFAMISSAWFQAKSNA